MQSFRSDESALKGREKAIAKLINNLPAAQRGSSLDRLDDIIDRYGPVVEDYPVWYPFVWNPGYSYPRSKPCADLGYEELDHLVLLKDAFISCPYSSGEKLVSSASSKDPGPCASIDAEILDFPLYGEGTTAVLVTCAWDQAYRAGDPSVPQRIAIGRMLQCELENWHQAEVAETWETMRHLFLGEPCGSRSSLFVNETTGMAMKRAWKAITEAGIYGPLMVAR